MQDAWKKEIRVSSDVLKLRLNLLVLLPLQYGRSDSYRVATTQDKDEKESPKKKGGKDLDDLKKEVPIVCTRPLNFLALSHS